ncbi:MAG: hypothetical protein CSA70_06125 [Rhodobacterales bacterium]|nr:MAG: hypothetical protein CSA70_06125 [Rhodobacterales bacterium]
MEETHGKLAIEGRPMSRVLPGFGGVVLLLAAAGLWVVPGSNWDSALMLIKLGLSLFLVLSGLALLQSAAYTIQPEVELDPRRGYLSLIERDHSGTVKRRTRLSYDDLSEVDFRDGLMIARNQQGQSVVEMPLESVDNLGEIRAALGPAFSCVA